MLKKNRSLYSVLLSQLPLAELSALYERSTEYSAIRVAIQREFDHRITETKLPGEPVHLFGFSDKDDCSLAAAI